MKAIIQNIASTVLLISVCSMSADTVPITDSGVGSPIKEKGILEFTVYVPSNGLPTDARAVRKTNTKYYLVVSGFVYFSRYGGPGRRLVNDACYEFNFASRPNPLGIFRNNQNVNVCNSRYNPQHQYRSNPFIPNGPLRFRIFDTEYSDNSRNLRVDVYRLDNKQKSYTSSDSFDNMLIELTDQKHLDSLNFDKILNSSANSSSNQQENSNNNVKKSGPQCRDQNPDPSNNSHRFDTNHNPSDKTYINCKYNKHRQLMQQQPYINGKRDGLWLGFTNYERCGGRILTSREIYRQGKRVYRWSYLCDGKTGNVFKHTMTAYSNDIQTNSTQWYSNGVKKYYYDYKPNGHPAVAYHYNRKGKLTYCTKYDNKGNPHNHFGNASKCN